MILSPTLDARRLPSRPISAEMKCEMRIPYVLHRVPESSLAGLLPITESPQAGDIGLAQVEKIGKNTGLELTDSRRCALHEGDWICVVFGNRYASAQFEAYAACDGDRCDLISMGGLCGLVKSKHVNVAEPTKLRLLGRITDSAGVPLHLQSFAINACIPPPAPLGGKPRVIVVVGTAMDVGKTHTVMSLIVGLKRQRHRVAAIKLTGTACGRDTWSMADAGASPVLNFVDGGFGSTYLCSSEELLDLHDILLGHASQAADCVVVEIADGLLQTETMALLRSPRFIATANAWVLATSDPVAAVGGAGLLRSWGIEAAAITGLITLSPLAMREAHTATGIPCLAAKELQQGVLMGEVMRKGLETA